MEISSHYIAGQADQKLVDLLHVLDNRMLDRNAISNLLATGNLPPHIKVVANIALMQVSKESLDHIQEFLAEVVRDIIEGRTDRLKSFLETLFVKED